MKGGIPESHKNPQFFLPPKKNPREIEKKKQTNNKNIPNSTKQSKKGETSEQFFLILKNSQFFGLKRIVFGCEAFVKGEPQPATLPGKNSRMYPLQKGIMSKGKDCLPAIFFVDFCCVGFRASKCLEEICFLD